MKKIFVVVFLISVFLQNIALAKQVYSPRGVSNNCNDDLHVDLTFTQYGDRFEPYISVTNKTSKRIKIKSLSFFFDTKLNHIKDYEEGSGVKYSSIIRVGSKENFKKRYFITLANNTTIKDGELSYSLSCAYGIQKWHFYLGLAIILIILILVKITKSNRKKDLSDYNKKNKIKFKDYSEYQEHIQEIADIEWEKNRNKEELEYKAQTAKRKADEVKRLKEEQKLEAEELRRDRLDQDDDLSEEDNGSLSGKIRRLKSLYKNGTLTKAEFEQAKNKLVK